MCNTARRLVDRLHTEAGPSPGQELVSSRTWFLLRLRPPTPHPSNHDIAHPPMVHCWATSPLNQLASSVLLGFQKATSTFVARMLNEVIQRLPQFGETERENESDCRGEPRPVRVLIEGLREHLGCQRGHDGTAGHAANERKGLFRHAGQQNVAC